MTRFRTNIRLPLIAALGQANAAQNLLKTLPPGLAEASDFEDLEGEEHSDYQRLFGVFATHDLVDEVYSRTPKATATKVEQHNWRKSLQAALDRVYRVTIELLTGDWLRLDFAIKDGVGTFAQVAESHELTSATQRAAELRRVRQIFIPELVLRLHARLFAARNLFPIMLQHAMGIVKIVAEEQNHAYEEFLLSGTRHDAGKLGIYLSMVREVALATLETGSGSPFEIAS